MLALALAGCSGDDDTPPATSPAQTADTAPQPKPKPKRRPALRLRKARCPAGLPGCVSASGRIIYVEAVDPDGDGDAHFVIIDRQGLTGPGVTAIDVALRLRPRPLPGPGDRVSAAGALATGSYGQKQIEAVVLHVARRR